MTPPRRIGIDIDRIVLNGVALSAGDLEVMRTAITVELSGWLTGMDASDLGAGAVPRVAPAPQTVISLADGRALGRSVAQAVRDAVERSGGRT